MGRPSILDNAIKVRPLAFKRPDAETLRRLSGRARPFRAAVPGYVLGERFPGLAGSGADYR